MVERTGSGIGFAGMSRKAKVSEAYLRALSQRDADGFPRFVRVGKNPTTGRPIVLFSRVEFQRYGATRGWFTQGRGRP